MINTGPGIRVEEEDIPDAVLGSMPGIQYMVEATLEPMGAPMAGTAMLRKLALSVSGTARGVIFDPRKESVELPRGIKKYSSPKRKNAQRFALLEFSWWFAHARILEESWIDSFLSLLEKYLPDGMPRRYGLREPPRHIYSETGRTHLKEFLAKNLSDSVVWYANKPVAQWSFSVDHGCGWRKLGGGMAYRCNRISATLDAAVLGQPGWPLALRRFWRKASDLIQPFFGDIRTLDGYTGRLPHVWSDGDTEFNPVQSWWWNGIPSKLGHAAVVGQPYLDLWPQIATAGESGDSLVFVSTDDWTGQQDLTALTGKVPAAIVMPAIPNRRETGPGAVGLVYPEIFPFGDMPPGVKIRKKPWWRVWNR